MSKSLALMPIVPQGSLEAYVATINNIPLLSAEDEHALAVRYTNEGDLDAAKQLVLSHLRFVVHIARSYSGYGLPQGDLDAFADAIVALSNLARLPDRRVREAEINPLLVRKKGDGVVAVDGLVILD